MNRLPAHDNTVARRSDGSEADFTSQDFIRAQAVLNSLNETQLTIINNDVLATISEVFDVDQIIGNQERSAQASGFILLVNLRIQILNVAVRSVRYMEQVLKEAAKPQTTLKGLLHVFSLIKTGLHHKALTH